MGSGKKSKGLPVAGLTPAGAAQGAKKVVVSKLPNGQVRVEVLDA